MCPGPTSWGGDHVLELAGVLAGLQDHLCAAQHCLRGEGKGDVAREACAHAPVRQRLDHEEHVRGAAAGQAGHRAQQLLVHLRPAYTSAPASDVEKARAGWSLRSAASRPPAPAMRISTCPWCRGRRLERRKPAGEDPPRSQSQWHQM